MQLGLDSLGDVFDRTLDADSGAMGRLLLAPAKTLAKKLGKSVTAPARWAVRKANEKVIGDHAGRARDAATSRYFSMKEAEE